MTKRLCFLFAALAAVPIAILAQTSTAAPAKAAAPAHSVSVGQKGVNPLIAGQKMIYTYGASLVVRSAEKMPEEDYSFKPTPDVRSYGQLIGHVADAQYMFCSAVLGEKSPSPGVEKTKTAKADLVQALKDAMAYCGKAYDAMNDTSALESVKIMGGDHAKFTVLSFNNVHTLEHYGNVVTYLRLKGIVPPSSEPSK